MSTINNERPDNPQPKILLTIKAINKPQIKLKDYLDSFTPSAGEDFMSYCWHIWTYCAGYFLVEKAQVLEVPDACIGEDNKSFMFTWERGEHYLECEIFIDRGIEFFYKNNKTNEMICEGGSLMGGFPNTILEKMSLFAQGDSNATP
jgi:hypothetical protein